MTNGEATKQRIFEAATELFARHGYADVSTRDISKAAKMSEGGIYRHYESKAAILDDILAKYKRTASDFIITKKQIDEYIESHTPRQLLAYCVEYFGAGEQKFISDAYRILCREHLTNRYANELMETITYDLIRENCQYTLDLLVKRGDIPPTDTKNLATIWTQAKLYTAQKWVTYSYDEKAQEKVVNDYKEMAGWIITVILAGTTRPNP